MDQHNLGENYTEEEIARINQVREADEQRKKDMWARQQEEETLKMQRK